jgi:TPR repeat protein
VGEDDVTAVEWFRKAADQEYAVAQCNLGVCYVEGEGVGQDDAMAVEWYRKAADQEYAVAQCNLGVCYEEGRGVGQDDAMAVEWYRKAADQGDADAQHNLGRRYANGKGVEKSEIQSTLYLCYAAENQEYSHLRAGLIFSREQRMDVMKLAKRQNWLNRRDFLIFLHSYTSYRGEQQQYDQSSIRSHTGQTGHTCSVSSRAGVAQVTAAGAVVAHADVKSCVFAVPHLSRLIGGYL